MTIWQRFKAAREAVHDPIKTDRSIDVTSGRIWVCYALFGIFTITQNASVFGRTGTPEFYQTLWGGGTGLFAAIAAAASFGSFLIPHARYDRRIAVKRIESFALLAFMGLVVLYPITLAFYGGAAGPRWDIFWVSVSYLMLPYWRVKHLNSRIKQLYHVAAVRQEEGL